ncbi:hypothetical protein GCM10027168_13340 [Streptomyces capparidis]
MKAPTTRAKATRWTALPRGLASRAGDMSVRVDMLGSRSYSFSARLSLTYAAENPASSTSRSRPRAAAAP